MPLVVHARDESCLLEGTKSIEKMLELPAPNDLREHFCNGNFTLSAICDYSILNLFLSFYNDRY